MTNNERNANWIVEELRPEEDWWKSSTEDAVFNTAIELLEARFDRDSALIVISNLISAIRAEYGN